MLERKMADFGRISRCGKLTPKPNPRLKNCSKTSQEPSARSGLSSYQYYLSQRLQSEKSQMRIFPNSGDFILIPTYNESYVKIQFLRQNTDWPFFGETHVMITSTHTRQPVLLHSLGCLVGFGPLHSFLHCTIGI